MRGFRVWSDYWKKYAIEAELYIDGSADAIFEDDDGVPHHENTDLVVEFKTGLKDKNGKGMHYGDIIKLDGRHARKDDARIYEVIEDEYYCCPTTRSIDKEDCDIYFNAGATEMYFTVIGNIHENHGLLEKEEE